MLIDFDLLTVILLFVVYIISVLILKHKLNKNAAFIIVYTLLYIYLSAVLKYTQFPIMIRMGSQEKLDQNLLNSINIVPFIHLGKEDIKTSILNFVMAVPFGVLVPMLKTVSLKKMLLYAVLFGFVIEGIQLIIALITGFTFRIIDINDIIFNGLGSMAGYYIYKVFIRILQKVYCLSSLPSNFVVEYLLQNEREEY